VSENKSTATALLFASQFLAVYNTSNLTSFKIDIYQVW